MKAVINEQARHMADYTAVLTQAQNEFEVAGIQELLVPIQTELVMDRFADEEGRVDHVTHAIANYVVIVTGFFAPEDFASLAVNVLDISKEGIPLWMQQKSLSHGSQRPGAEAVIGVQDVDNLPGGAEDTLVHGVIVSFILL